MTHPDTLQILRAAFEAAITALGHDYCFDLTPEGEYKHADCYGAFDAYKLGIQAALQPQAAETVCAKPIYENCKFGQCSMHLLLTLENKGLREQLERKEKAQAAAPPSTEAALTAALEALENERDCKHGQLARPCEICGLEAADQYNAAIIKAAGLQLVALRAENAALKASVREYGDAIERLSADREESLKDKVALAMEIEALKAELAAMRDQKPVAYWNPQERNQFYWATPTLVTAPITVNVHPMALYAAPGAK